MVKRQQQPLISIVLVISLSTLLATCHFASDLHSERLFLVKAALQPITLMTLSLLIVYAAFVKHKWLVYAVVYAIIVNVAFLLPNINMKTKSDAASNTIRVATFSTLTRTSNVLDIVNFAVSEAPDILCLQEVAANDRRELINRLSSDYPYYVQNNNNQIIFSHLSLTVVDDSGYYLASNVLHPKMGKLTLVNTHMPRPYLSEGVSSEWGAFLDFIDNDSNIIICGDLNITPNNSLYETLKYQYHLKDSLTQGYGFTYPNAQRRSALVGPLIRIDYILSRHLSSANTRTINASNLSDHRAVISDLTIEKNNN